MYDGLTSMDSVIVCDDSSLTKKDIFDVYKSLYWDNPYFFYLDNQGFEVEVTIMGAFHVIPRYLFSKEEVLTLREKISRNATNLIRQADIDNVDDYEKVKRLHDLICKNVTYDMSVINNTASLEDEIYSKTILGLFLRKNAICEGISKSFKFLLNAVGIHSIVLTGSSKHLYTDSSDEDHAWNLVKIDGRNVHIDLTWDICLSEEDHVRYDYFCLNDKSIFRDHLLLDEDFFPKADNESFDYYKNAGCDISDENELRKYINDSINSSMGYLCYRVQEKSDYVYLAAKGQDFIFDRLMELGINAGISQSLNENQRAVEFIVK